MRRRVLKLLGAEAGETSKIALQNAAEIPFIGTFHSFCVKVLRKNIHHLNFENQFAIYDTSDQAILMKHILKEQHIDEKQLNPKAVLSHISTAKNGMISPREYEIRADSYFAEKVARLYHRYEEELKRNNALDFDDLLLKVIELFKKHPAVLAQHQERFRYILVDEYQDTNAAQYMITTMLAQKHRNLCVVGDSDQGIYAWRGASIQNILDFEKEYPDCTVIKLEQNYRSTKKILDVAQSIISKNRRRHDKMLWTERAGGTPVELRAAEHERHEGEIIAQTIKTATQNQEHPDYRDFVVLYRTNAQSRSIEEVFMRWGIPYKIVGGIRFYERKEIKDMLAYLRVIANPADSVSLLRIINTPQRNIGPKTLEKLQRMAQRMQVSLFAAMRSVKKPSGDDEQGENVTEENEAGDELSSSKREAVKKFTALIERLQEYNKEHSASALLKFVLAESGYKQFIDDGSIEGEARLENIAELISVAAKYDKLAPGMSLSIFLEEISLITDIDSLDEKDNAVTLMTLHSAKGLEFQTVFIAGVEEGLLPHSRAILSMQELEEERRLFYVGCTRAMDNLYLLYAKNRMFYGESRDSIPSQFLDDIPAEMLLKETDARMPQRRSSAAAHFGTRPIPTEGPPKEALDFADGDRVHHKIFGDGVVVNVVGGIITVAFKNPKIGIKKLAINIAPLERIE